MDHRFPPRSLDRALEITWISVNDGRITLLGGRNADGSLWHLTEEEVIKAIGAGARFYITRQENAYLLTLERDAQGNTTLNEGLSVLLRQLPHRRV